MAHLKSLARLAVTAGVLWFVFRAVDARQVLDAARSAHPAWLVGALGLALATRVLFVARWRALLAALEIRVPLRRLVPIVLVSMFLGQALPGVAGGDVLRGTAVARAYGKPGRVALSLAANSLFAGVSLLALTLAGLALAPRASPVRDHTTAILVAVAVALGVLMILAAQRRGRVGRILSKLALSRRSLLFVSATSLLGQAFRCGAFLVLYRALGVEVGLAETFVLVAAMSVVLLVPASLGGLGVREASLAVLFGQLGVPAETSVAVGFLYYAVQAASALPGAWWWIRHRAEPQAPASSRSTRSHSSSNDSASASRAARSDSSDRTSSGETES